MGTDLVIGLEVHAQLRTRTKMFCSCPVSHGAPPNSCICPVCAGLPGALPTPNRSAIEQGARAALALGAEVRAISRFARKSYFYPDLPKGYQITQHHHPLATGGAIWAESTAGRASQVRVRRLHLEEDSGKSVIRQGEHLVDLNRAGVPLIEVVTEPDISSPEEAEACLRALRTLLRALGVCDGDMELGSLRCDANLSTVVGPGGRTSERIELKNLNSFKHLRDALSQEARRQAEVIRGGGTVRRQTRAWSPSQRTTRSVRTKETSSDYRYLPEPDLPPLRLRADRIEALRAALPELPLSRAARFERDLGLRPGDASRLAAHPEVSAYFEGVVEGLGDPGRAAAFVLHEVLPKSAVSACRATFPVPAGGVAELLRLVEEEQIVVGTARKVLAVMARTGQPAAQIVSEQRLGLRRDGAVVAAACARVMDEHPEEVARYRAGKRALIDFLVGRVMRAARGRLSAVDVRRALTEQLGEPTTGRAGASCPDDGGGDDG